MIDPNIELVTDSNDWASGGEEGGKRVKMALLNLNPRKQAPIT